MKLPARRKRPSKKLLIISAALLVGLAAGGYWYWHQRSVANATPKPSAAPANTVNYQPATAQEKTDSTNAKQNIIDGTDPDRPATTGTVTVTISRASQVGSTVSVRTIVTGTPDGSCTMKFTKGGQTTLSKDFPIVQGPTAATCNGDIAASEFSASGDWQLSVTAKNSTAATQTVSVNK